MFIEPHIRGEKRGWIEVICGSMFSGKTEELIRRLKRAQFANQKVEIFKPQVDTRYDSESIVSHDANKITSTPVSSSQNILILGQGVEVIGIDEAQFFDDSLPEVCEKLALQGIRIIVSGLDMDYLGNPFGPIPMIMAKAEYVTKLHAICVVCGNLATHSYRHAKEGGQVLIGEKDRYEPRCRQCYHRDNSDN